MIADSVQRVLSYLEGRAAMPQHTDEVHGVCVNREDEPRVLTVADLTDLVRRSLLLDSMVEESARQDALITSQRELIEAQREEILRLDELLEATS